MSSGRRPPLVDDGALATWMDTEELAVGEPISVERITSGHSNELFRVERGSLRLALRRPPRTPLSPTAHDMAREFRVLTAIREAGALVPVATPIRLCADASVIGAPFYLMELVDGLVARHNMPERLVTGDLGDDVATALVGALVGIHGLAWRTSGLEDFGRPDGYVARQVERWLGQLDRYRTRPLPDVDTVAAWLGAHQPPAQEPTLLHGDFTLVNVMLARQPPIELVAVVDWELATIGDPLVDLGWLLGLWHEPGEPLLPGADAGVMGLPGVPGMPRRRTIAAMYADRSGRDLSHLGFYCALALFKLACIMEGSYARYTAGTSDDPYFAALEASVPALAHRAVMFTDGFV
ncbi:MAG: phosphotransferase family protein [Acidimicrobiia bacterium]